MKFSFDRKAAIEEIAVAMQTVETSSLVPALGLLELTVNATAQHVVVYSTNIDNGIKCRFSCQADGDAKFSTRGQELHSWLSNAPGDVVEASLAVHLSLKCGSARARLKATDQTLPPLPPLPTTFFKLKSEDLKKALSRTVFVVPTKETQTANGVLAEDVGEDWIAFVGTDGRCLSVQKVSTAGGSFTGKKILIDRKACQIVIAMIGKTKSEFTTVYYDDRHLSFGFGNRLICSRGITGHFQKWQSVKPNVPNSCVVKKDDIVAAINCVCCLSTDDGRPIVLEFDPAAGELRLNAVGDSEAVDTIQAACSEGGRIKVNGKWLLESCSKIEAENVCLSFGGELAPLEVFEGEDKEWRFLIAPMSIDKGEGK